MASRKRKCIVCGKEYEYCPNCRADSRKPAWMLRYDSPNCKEIYDICSEYAAEQLDKIEAKARLKKCDLSDMAHFSESTQRIINEIMPPVKAKPAKKAAAEEKVEE